MLVLRLYQPRPDQTRPEYGRAEQIQPESQPHLGRSDCMAADKRVGVAIAESYPLPAALCPLPAGWAWWSAHTALMLMMRQQTMPVAVAQPTQSAGPLPRTALGKADALARPAWRFACHCWLSRFRCSLAQPGYDWKTLQEDFIEYN